MKKKAPYLFLLLVVFGIGMRVGANRPRDIVRSPSQSQVVATAIPFATTRTITASTTKKTEKNEYVANKKTKKFHKPSCSSVKQMNESNKIYYTCTREEMISNGYDPCGRCHP